MPTKVQINRKDNYRVIRSTGGNFGDAKKEFDHIKFIMRYDNRNIPIEIINAIFPTTWKITYSRASMIWFMPLLPFKEEKNKFCINFDLPLYGNLEYGAETQRLTRAYVWNQMSWKAAGGGIID